MIISASSAYVVEERKDKERKGGKRNEILLLRLYREDLKNLSISSSSSSDGCRVADSLSQNSGQQKNKCMNNKLGTLIIFFSRNTYLQKASYSYMCQVPSRILKIGTITITITITILGQLQQYRTVLYIHIYI